MAYMLHVAHKKGSNFRKAFDCCSTRYFCGVRNFRQIRYNLFVVKFVIGLEFTLPFVNFEVRHYLATISTHETTSMNQAFATWNLPRQSEIWLWQRCMSSRISLCFAKDSTRLRWAQKAIFTFMPSNVLVKQI